MKFPRRQFLYLAASAVAVPAVTRMARAQSYPTRPVHLIVGFAAGSTTDILGRLMGQWLSQRLGQQFIIDNRPGAGGNVGAEAMVRSAPDGYTLYMVPPAVAANATGSTRPKPVTCSPVFGPPTNPTRAQGER